MTGPLAWLFSLFRAGSGPPPPGLATPTTTLQTHLVQVAGTQLGVAETSRNRGGEIEKYWSATSYPDGMAERQPWCAAFVAWCLREAVIRRYGSEGAAPFRRCRSARVYDWLEWARGERMVDLASTPRPGDLAIYQFSHCGVVRAVLGGDRFACIEGNTDDQGGREGVEVAVRDDRRVRQVKAFLRLPS